MDKRLGQLKISKARLVSICRIAQWAFLSFLVIYCLSMLAVIFYSVLLPSGFEYVGPTSFVGLLPIICNSLASALTLAIIWRMTRAIGRNDTPFSPGLVKGLVTLGILFVFGVITGALVTPNTIVGAINGNEHMALEYSAPDNSSIRIEAGRLLASIACFVLAAVFQYGSILQEETDDLM